MTKHNFIKISFNFNTICIKLFKKMSFGTNLSHLLNLDESSQIDQLTNESSSDQSLEQNDNSLQSFSNEQKDIIDTMGNNNDSYINAVAGSGKTSTILWIANSYPDKQILQLTYNSELKAEVRTKVDQYGLQNIRVDSYHSLIVRYYNHKGFTDEIMRDVVYNNKSPIKKIKRFDIIVIDEAQDMRPLFFQLVHKLISDMHGDPQLLILGDEFQCIYKFMEADSRFLTFANQLWQNSRPMIQHSLSTSYRITNTIAWFVNEIMYGQHRITANKEGSPIDYIYCESFNAYYHILPYLMKVLRNKEIKPEDIFVLVPSVKSSKSPMRELEHALVNKNIPCHLSTSDEKKLDKKDIAGKVVFTTFHKAKGRERPIVIIYGFDSSYFELYKKDCPTDICTNELYVACTRASKKLILIHDSQKGTLPFLLINKFEEKTKKTPSNIRFLGEDFDYPTNKIIRDNRRTNSVIELIKFLKDKHLTIITPLIESLFETIENPYYSSDIQNKIHNQQGLYEDVSDLNGLAIPAMFEMKRTGKITLFERLEQSPYKDTYLREAITNIQYPCKTIKDCLYLANVYLAAFENVHYRIKQIDGFNWITQKMVDQCCEHIEKYLSFDKQTIFEKNLAYIHKHRTYGSIELAARLDAVNNENIWEFKCVNSLQIDHLLQLVVYAWMWINAGNSPRKFFIMNIRTGETLKLKTPESLEIGQIAELLLKNKYDKIDELSDEEFINECKKQKEKFKQSSEPRGTPPLTPPICYFDNGGYGGIPPNYSNLKLERLKKLCKERRIKGYSKKKKNEIINLLIDYDNGDIR